MKEEIVVNEDGSVLLSSTVSGGVKEVLCRFFGYLDEYTTDDWECRLGNSLFHSRERMSEESKKRLNEWAGHIIEEE